MHKNPTPRSNTTDITSAQAVDMVLERALERGASDIHFEPRERNVVVRYRIDGWLQEAAKFPLVRYRGVARQIKQRSNLEADDKLPQNGVSEYNSAYGPATIRVATMPTVTGEKIVLHLQPRSNAAVTLENLGYWGAGLRAVNQAIAEPHGLVISASPNQSSMGMSLLAMVRALNNPAYTITTLESPISQLVPGVSQTELKPGASFAAYLQAALKLDPNVVMLSHIPDAAAASLATHAALNGRLMLGGVPASGTAEAIKHLLHLRQEPYMIASGLKVVAHQQFVRTPCRHCRQQYLPGPAERRRLSALLTRSGIKTLRQIQELEADARDHGLGTDTHGHPLPLSTTEKRIRHLWKADPHGCGYCHFTGYFGRVGICEVLEMSDPVRAAIAADKTAAIIHHKAVAAGMLPLQLDGFIKALRGLTTMSEVFALPVSRSKA